MFPGPAGLLHRHSEAIEPSGNLRRAKEPQARDMDSPLDHRRGRPVPTEKRPPVVDMDDRGGKPLPLHAPISSRDPELEGAAAVLEYPAGDGRGGPDGSRHRTTGDEPGEEQAVVGDVEHPLGAHGQMPGGAAGGEGAQQERAWRRPFPILHQRPHRGQMDNAARVGGGDDAFEDQWHAWGDSLGPAGQVMAGK